MQIRAFAMADTEAVIALWHEVGITRAWNDPRRDIERKMTVQPELFLVGIEAGTGDQEGETGGSGTVIASAMSGFDGHRGWLYYFAVTPDRQGEGLGTQLLAEVERLLTARGCPKLNVQVRDGDKGVIERYAQWGYALDGAAGLGKRLIPD